MARVILATVFMLALVANANAGPEDWRLAAEPDSITITIPRAAIERAFSEGEAKPTQAPTIRRYNEPPPPEPIRFETVRRRVCLPNGRCYYVNEKVPVASGAVVAQDDAPDGYYRCAKCGGFHPIAGSSVSSTIVSSPVITTSSPAVGFERRGLFGRKLVPVTWW